MQLYKHKFSWFLGGAVVGMLVAIALQLLVYLYFIPSWLVVENVPVISDAAVVLGGGKVSRLRKAIDIYDAGMVKEILLVDTTRDNWSPLFKGLGADYEINQKKIIFVTGSSTTETDAQLSLKQCINEGIKSVIVITDPYHSRRASINFNRVYAGSGIKVVTAHSGDFEGMRQPSENWRKHKLTRDLVWLETGKTVGALLPTFLRNMFAQADR